MSTATKVNSVSIEIAPRDHRCRYWAKLIDADMALALPAQTDRAADIPGNYLREGEEELLPGDFLIEGEENHHRKDRGWTYRVSYLGIDGELHQVVPTAEMKQAMKASGMSPALLRGSGLLAACVRLIEGLRQNLDCDVVPLDAPEAAVSAVQYASVKAISSAWFKSDEAANAEPDWKDIVSMAKTMGNKAPAAEAIDF